MQMCADEKDCVGASYYFGSKYDFTCTLNMQNDSKPEDGRATFDYNKGGSGLVTTGSGERDFICDIKPVA